MNSKNYFLLFNLIFFFLSFSGSVYQSFFVYDPFHWGLAQSSIEIFSTSLPYKDTFIHYGFLYTLTNSLLLELSNNNLIYTMYLSSFFYSSGNFLLCYIAYEKFKIKTYYILPIILFLTHPFANHPWYNYQFYFLIVISIYFFLNEKKYSLFFTGLFISLSCLVYENFIYLGFFMVLTAYFLKIKNNKSYLILIGFFIPQFLFHFYLFIFNLHEYWIKSFWLNEVFLKIYDLTFLELIIKYFKTFLTKGLLNVLTQPYYLLFLLIFISNIYFLFNFIFIKKIVPKKKNLNLYLFFISLFCLLTYASTLHKLTIFRFSTGPIIGIIVLIYFIELMFPKDKNKILILFVVILASSSFVPIKQENNRFFPLFHDMKNNSNLKNIKYFSHQKWRDDTWKVLNEIDTKNKLISSKCYEVSNFINYTEDAFIYILTKQYLNSKQYLFWYENTEYYKLLAEHFNVDMEFLIKNINKKRNAVIFFNLKDLSYFKKKIDFDNFSIINLPYSYQQKRKGMIIPNTCLKKII